MKILDPKPKPNTHQQLNRKLETLQPEAQQNNKGHNLSIATQS